MASSLDTLLLSPDPVQMHLYLDKWITHIDEIKTESARLIKVLSDEIVLLKREIGQLKQQGEDRVRPLETQLAEYAARIENLTRAADVHNTQMTNVKNRLAAILDEPISPSTTVDRLLASVVLLVDETKKQFQESL